MENNKLALQDNKAPALNFFDPEQFAHMQRVAGMFMASELVPDMYKISDKNPKDKAIANTILALDMSNRLGANILMVMQNLVLVNGRPSWSSKFLIGTINTCGRFEPLKYKFEDLGEIKNIEYYIYEWDAGAKKNKAIKKIFPSVRNTQCFAYTTAKGDKNVLEGSKITIEMAIKEGWYTRTGSKWQTMPEQMLRYRAASFWNNAYAPELSMGMRTEDEARDIIDADFEEIIDQKIAANANKQPIDIKPEPKEEEKQPEPETKTNSVTNNIANMAEEKKEEQKEPEPIEAEPSMFAKQPGF